MFSRAPRHFIALVTAALACVCLTLTTVGAGATAQTQRPFRILLTNDDGVRSPGILAVALALRGQVELTIAAPSENQSGKGHSITTSDPIFVDTITLGPDLPAYSLQTTPASCVTGSTNHCASPQSCARVATTDADNGGRSKRKP